VPYVHIEKEIQKKKQAPDQLMMDNFYDERPDMTTVYFEPREHLNQHTQYLHRAGLVVLRQGGHHPNLKRAIATTIATQVGWRADDYEVYSCGLAHYIVLNIISLLLEYLDKSVNRIVVGTKV
jgi:hypothetical protein